MNRHLKILTRIAYAVFAIFFFASIVVTSSFIHNDVKAEETEETPTLSISTDYDDLGYVIGRNSTNFIYFNLSLSSAPKQDVIVYFHAEDRTAISEAGDYYLVEEDSQETDKTELAKITHKQSYVTLNELNYKSVTIEYHISKTSYTTVIDDLTSVFNTFIFSIDKINGANYTGDSKYTCRLNYEYVLPLETDEEDNGYYCPYFLSYGEDKTEFSLGKKEVKESNYDLGFDYGDETWETIYNKTVNNGFGDLAVNGIIDYIKSNYKNAYDFYVTLHIKDSYIFFQEIDNIAKGDGNYWSDSSYKSEMSMGERSGMSDMFTKTYSITAGSRTEKWYCVPKEYGYNVTLELSNVNNTRTGRIWVTSKLNDRVAPTMENYYIDTSSMLYDGKIRLLMRFSEVVDGQDTQVKASLQSRYDILFKYAEGSGTNTLVYEANVNTDDYKTQSIKTTFIEFDGLEGTITDVGYNWDKESRNKCAFQFESYEKAYIDLDLRKPSIADPPIPNSGDITRTRDINIVCNKMTNGKIYYVFVPANEESLATYESEDDFKAIIENSDGKYTNFVGGCQEVLLTDVDEDVEVSFTVASPPKINGEYYLYIFAISSLGKTDISKYGKVLTSDVTNGYAFDNEAPNLTIVKDNSSTSTKKILNFTAYDKFTEEGIIGESSGLAEVGIKLYDGSNPDNVVDFILWSNVTNVNYTNSGNDTEENNCKLTDSFVFDIVTEDLGEGEKNYLKVKSQYICELNANGYGTYYYYFYAVDEIGNITTIDDSLYTAEKYDLRTLFSYTWESNKDNLYSEIDNDNVTGIEENVYNYNSDSGKKLEISIVDTETTEAQSEVVSIYKLYFQGTLVYTSGVQSDYSEYLESSLKTDSYKKNLTVSPLKTGKYSMELMLTRTLVGGDSLVLYAADPIEFYATNRSNNSVTYDNTTNYGKVNNNLVFVNKVFELGTSYYYVNSTDKVTIVPYNNCQSSAAFSNSTIATNYVRFMEYQDLQMLRIEYDQDGAQIVSFLNSTGGSTKYQKADGQESIKAALGQTWVRYKRSSWTTGNGEEGWAYYFYSDRLESSINISTLLGNNTQFSNAISSIVSYIIKQGSTVYLTDDDYFDNYNAPKLTTGQYHYSNEQATTTMTGDLFSSTLVFEGDTNIYSDYIEVSKEKYKLATNLILSVDNDNKLYYYNKQAKQLVPINVVDGQTLAVALGSSVGSGTYKIIEIDNNGVSEFEVYVDISAPVVSISWVGTGDDATDQTFSANLNGRNDGDVYSAKNMTINSVSSSMDIDPYAYVVVYTAPSYTFVSIQYYSTLASNPIVLEDGNYYIVVGDRSGNVYTFTAQICSEDLIVTVEKVDNSYIVVTTNRDEDQIDRYEVRCNNVIINQAYNKTNKFSEAGYYNIYVKDIYGNTNSNAGQFGTDYMFEREIPEVTWYYLDSSSTPIPYEKGITKIMKISQGLEGGIFYINTSRYLKFTYDGDYSYEITGVDSSNISKSTIGSYAIIQAVDDWQLEIWYNDYPDVRAKYIVTMDTTAPSVQVNYRVSSYGLVENDNIEIAAINAKVGSNYTLNSIEYQKGSTITRNVSEGDVINSSFITLDVTDLSGVQSVYIYLDDELLKKFENIDGKFSSLSLNKSGVYKIVATDSFDNVRTFNFENNAYDKMTATIDGVKVKSGSDTQYGNSDFVITTGTNSQILIKVSNYVLYYTLSDGALYLTKYVCLADGDDKYFEATLDTKLVDNETVLNSFFDVNNTKIMPYEEKEFIANNLQIEEYSSSTKIKGVRFFVSYDSNKNVVLRFASSDSERVYLEASLLFSEYEEPYYFNTILSKEVSEISFVTDDDEPFNATYGQVSRINDSFKPVLNNISNISKVEASYSATREFVNIVEVYGENGYKEFDTTENGFYLFRVENIFGNVIEYIINRSDEFIVLSFAEYDDKEQSSFDSAYGENLVKANSKVKFEAYTDQDDNLAFTLKNLVTGETQNVIGQYVDGYYSFVFTEIGKYKFTLMDTFGNVAVRNFEIKNTSLTVDDEILNGYNEEALLRDKGYTNQKITIVKDKIDDNDVKYISLITSIESEEKGVKVVTKTEKIIYNTLTQDAVGIDSRYAYIVIREYQYSSDNIATLVSQNKYIVDLLDDNKVVDISSDDVINNSEFTSKFNDIVGCDGNGDYQVLFRDSYGGIDKKEVHYKGDSTLLITRKTRSDKNATEISVDDAIANGVWSNANVEFNTTSQKFELIKISNGESQPVQSLPLSLNVTADGSYTHTIKYIDEYGNKCTIVVHLVRQELEVNLTDNIQSFIVEDVVTTRDNISITFPDKCTCKYRLNSGDEIDYTSGDILYRDGSYRFTVTDYAGNVTSKTFKKDTICEFTFKVPTTEKILINGEVINTGYVKFETANDDTTYIKKVFYNDEITTEDDTYSKAGKWSFIIEDKAGNKTMFEFYIVNHDLSIFEYKTPNNYKITELWYNDGSDILVDYMSYVNDSTANSDFSIDENGTYVVVMTSTSFNNSVDFTFTINKSLPNVTLSGCSEGEKTINSVTIDGCNTGDTVEVYKDGKLDQTVVIEDKSDVPTISEGGRYTIVVTNQAGMSKSLSFIRTKIPNVPSSILIIVFSVLIVGGIIFGTILRNRQKIDD